jgi:monoamine oxidase
MTILNSGTSWFDQSFSEQVLEAAVFDPHADWRCIMGGAQQVVRRMLDKILKDAPKTKVQFGSPVTAIGLDSKPTPQSGKPYITAGGKTIQYDAVFNSAPLGCMRRMDLTGLPLTYGTKQALRALNYGASCKVGVRFSEMWWISRMNIQGGLGKTDLPIRVCVYPSYNLADPPKEGEGGGVLLCSYSWAQDADRMGATIKPTSPEDEDTLRELLFDNLALLHSTKDDYEEVRKLISGSYQTHYAFDWTRNELSTGAFAWFGPGQFRNMYPEIIQTDGRHIMIGEIASSHHAWIVGALDSAVRGVYQFLYRHALLGHHGCKAALELYEAGKVPSPYGPVPVEFNRPSDVLNENGEKVANPVAGEFASFLTVLETARLEQEVKAAAAA